MQRLAVGSTEFARCFRCSLTRLTLEQLETLTQQRVMPELTGLPVGRCRVCSGDVWGTTVMGLQALHCVGCDVLLLSDTALTSALQLRRVGERRAELSFVCAGCGDSYAMTRAHRVAAGLACETCAPTLPPEPPAAAPSLGSRVGPEETALDLLLDVLSFL